MVMTAGGGFRHTRDRNKLILAGIAFSAFCMALTRITLLLTEDHAYGIFTGLREAYPTHVGRSSGSFSQW